MKTKLLITALTAGIIAACGSDNVNFVVVDTPPPPVETIEIQAFDGPVTLMDTVANCGSTSYNGTPTDINGYSYFSSNTAGDVVNTPQNCSYTFTASTESVDAANGKSMAGAVYKAPIGMFAVGQPKAASPVTTLLTNILGDQPYDDSTASELIEDLGLGTALSEAGVSVIEFLSNPEESIETIKALATPGSYSRVVTVTQALHDVLIAAPDGATPEQMVTVTNNATAVVLRDYPNFPESNGEQVYFDIKSALVTPTLPGKTLFDEVAEKLWTPEEVNAVGGVGVSPAKPCDENSGTAGCQVQETPECQAPAVWDEDRLECMLPDGGLGTGSGSGSGTGGSGGGTGG
ncbi:hypothetical protein [Paraferrimonas sp. SM1919]|uniref:hypothetical protein n=1 Tax=Paraferrimonas sp. SM1919 TaxID=2662263 RepID=UPI0013CFA473|nr:hypothetical protein [Paraferrimonas sp. SM1919]